MFDAIAIFVFDMLLPGIACVTPARPLWLRRLVQAFWILVALALLAAFATGMYLLVLELT